MHEHSKAIRKILKEYEESWDVIDDLEQEVYLRALQSDPPAGDIKDVTWMCAIAKNVGRMHVRAAHADKRANEVGEVYIEGDFDEGGYMTPYYDRGDLSADLSDRQELLDPYYEYEAEQALDARLSAMPDRMADVVMRRLAGLSNPEIAEQLGVAEKTVRNLVHESSKYFRDNSEVTATNSVYSERNERPVERFASQADVERAVRERFARRDSAFRKRQVRLAHPDASTAEWRELYETV